MTEFAQWFSPLGLCRTHCGKPATGSLMSYRNEKLGDYCKRCADAIIKRAHRKGDFWPDAVLATEAIRMAHVPAATVFLGLCNDTIRRMALAIISLNDKYGTCTEAALIWQGFTADQVAELHEAACVRAGLLMGNQPFVVVRAGLDAGDAP